MNRPNILDHIQQITQQTYVQQITQQQLAIAQQQAMQNDPSRISQDYSVLGNALAQMGRQPLRPVIGILDPRFKYTPAASTDIRKTWARARAEMAAKQKPKKEGKK